MNITVNDLDMNSTLDQAAMAALFGGRTSTSVGSWFRTGSSSTGIRATSGFHMGGWHGNCFKKKRYGHQHGKRTVTVYYKRRIRQQWCKY